MLSSLREDILPILYISTVLSGLMYLYNPSLVIFFTVSFVVLIAGFFLLLRRLRREGTLGGLFYLVIAAGALGSSWLVIAGGAAQARQPFAEWFFNTQSASTVAPAYSAALALNAAVLLGGAAFYFTNVLYRPAFLFLLCLIPSAVSSKNGSEYPLVFSCITIMLFLLICIQYRPRVGSVSITPKKLASAGSDGAIGYDNQNAQKNPFPLEATAVVGIVCIILPSLLSLTNLEERAPLKSVFENAVMNSIFGVNSGNSLTNFTSISSTGGAPNNAEQLLFTVAADEPLYLRSQVFDIYNDETARWETLKNEDYNTGYDSWKLARQSSRYTDLVNALKWAADEYPSEFVRCFGRSFSSAVTTAENTPNKLLSAVISINSSPTAIVFNAENFRDVLSVGEDTPVYRTEKDEYFTEHNMDADEKYTIRFYSRELDESVSGVYSCDEFYKRLGELLYNCVLDAGNENYSYLNRSYTELAEAMQYDAAVYQENYDTAAFERDDRITALAAEITNDAATDLEKAKRIERYFHENGFVYNSNYEACGGSIATFLFDKKNGVCSDFASAMVVLARKAGLTARYTQGFSVSEKADDGLYNVRSKHSHAFPEIYITGYGWRIFEPTVSMNSTYSEAAATEENGGNANGFIALGVLVLAFAAAIMVYAKREQIGEAVFRVKLSLAPREKKLILIFMRLQRLTRKLINADGGDIHDSRAISAEMVENAVLRYLGKDVSMICRSLNKTSYGGENAAEVESERIYEEYKGAVRAYRKR